MQRDITSINENDVFELAYQINSWSKVNYMVVVNEKGQITGRINEQIFKPKNIQKRNSILIKKIMNKTQL